MNKKTLITLFTIASFIILVSCTEDKKPEQKEEVSKVDKELMERANTMFASLPEVASSESNPVTEEKVALGKKLYYDTRLSKDGNNSCNSCHNISKYGVDNLPTSPGDKGESGERNSPTVFNAALHSTQFWDGRSPDVEDQAGGPIVNPIEMAIPNEEFLIKRINEIDEYKKLFKSAFEGEEVLTFENIRKAIAAFERTLITPSKFDDYLKGDYAALDDNEKEGLKIFMDSGCITCHNGALLGGTTFQKFGVHHPYWEYTDSESKDEGRYTVTGNEADKYMFKVPSLRNVAETWPYFHDGSVKDLGKAIDIMAKTQLNKELSQEEIDKMVEFMKALTGEIPKDALVAAN